MDKRAMTVKVDEASGVAGFLNPDNRVDVVVTVDKGDFNEDPISKVVLQNLRVLGTGQEIEKRLGEKPQVVPTVTLEVTPEEGERLALATKEGNISLVLRNQQDEQMVTTSGVRTSTLLGNAAPKPTEAVQEDSSPPPAQYSVEVIRRLAKESMTF
jgi:pilus assembly protein CpaB